MKIENSSITMSSVHEFYQYSGTSKSLSVSVPGQKENSLGFFQNYLKQPLKEIEKPQNQNSYRASGMTLKLLLLRRIFDAIAGRNRLDNKDMAEIQAGSLMDLRSDANSSDLTVGSVWQRTTTTTSFYHESEMTSFTSTGYANTADGRTISFDVELSMSRSFTSVFSSYETVDYFVTDPLMIDVGDNGASVSDVKFLFDLDQDGEQEEISFAGKGNGFLALDKNGDGQINDGSELFGTKSGDGFKDLAEYDTDHNGWIDENDDIFSKLRVWTKDEDGNDKLIDLLSADVGAIYLGNAKTDFAMTNEYNYANAFLRSTGIFLRESGGVGTISQVDLTS